MMTIHDAEAYAAAFPAEMAPPTLDEYRAGLQEFLQVSSSWHGLEEEHFYVATRHGSFREDSDNALGGLDVSWAFHKTPSAGDIAEAYVRLMAELKECLDDQDIHYE